MTMESKINPAAAASLSPSGEYTKSLTTEVEYVRPAAKNPTTYPESAVCGHRMELIAYSNMVCMCCVRPHYHEHAHNDAK